MHGIVVLYDPTGFFRPGATFSQYDFETSLAGCVWPEGMCVRILKTGRCYEILNQALTSTDDRDWKAWREMNERRARFEIHPGMVA
jgi:hypothetical protein